MTKSPADMLADIGRALYGEHWRRSLADDLDVDERQIRRWVNGDTLTSEHGLFADAQELLRRRARELTSAATKLDRWREASR